MRFHISKNIQFLISKWSDRINWERDTQTHKKGVNFLELHFNWIIFTNMYCCMNGSTPSFDSRLEYDNHCFQNRFDWINGMNMNNEWTEQNEQKNCQLLKIRKKWEREWIRLWQWERGRKIPLNRSFVLVHLACDDC